MPAKQSYNRKISFGYCCILMVTLLHTGGYLLAAEKATVPVEPRYRIFDLKHISVEQAKTFIADANLGTASQLPAANMILLTAQPRQLSRAGVILQLVDSKIPYAMKAILPASAAPDLPSIEQIEAELDNISIGSFSNPPSGAGKAKAIIDIHGGSVVVISPAEQLAQIIGALKRYDSKGAFGQLQKVEPVQSQPPLQTLEIIPRPEPEANEIAEARFEKVKSDLEKLKTKIENGGFSSKNTKPDTDSEQNGLFGKLLNGLAGADNKDADRKQVEPAQPSRSEPEPNEPAAKLSEEPNEAAVVEKTTAEKIVAGAKPAPDVSSEQGVADIEEPNQVSAIEHQEPNTTAKVIDPTGIIRAYQPQFANVIDDTLELDLPSKINIIDLLDLVGKYLGLDYMYDPADIAGLKGEVTLVLQGPIKVRALYLLAESVLKFKGFVMTRRGNLVTIVPITKAPEIDAPIVDPDNPSIQPGDVIITQVFRLKHIDTTSAQNLLTGMKLGVNVTPIAEMGILIVSEYAYRMERIQELVDMIDLPGEEKVFRFRALEYTTAATLAAKVKALAEQLGTVSITVAAPTATAATATTLTRPGVRMPTPPRPTTPTTAAAAAKKEESVYLDADERTNRILMIGLESQLAVVDSLIDALDVEQKDLRTLRLYEIQHVDAEEVRNKLEELGLISTGRGAAASGRTVSRTPIGTTPTRAPLTAPPSTAAATTTASTSAIEEPLAEEPQVVIIEPTNSLLVNATAEQHIRIAMIIGYVDSTQEEAANPYVIYPLENQDPEELAGVLEKLISETITEQSGTDSKVVRTTTKRKIEEDIFIVPDTKSYSLIVYASKKNQQWISSLIEELDQYRPQVLLDVTLVEISKNDEFSLDLDLISKFPVLAGGESMEYLSSMIDPFPSKRIVEAVSTSGAGSGFYADRHIQALLTAMQTKGYGRVLAKPKLLVNDNEEGTIKAETKTTVVSPKTQVVPGTGVSASTAATSVDLQTYTEGITLTITPHISKGDQLRLSITVTRTDFGLRADYSLTTPEGKLTGPTPPDLLTSDVTTTVTVPDKSTIILGGLEKLKQTKGGTKVPLIGDIPLVGGLFRSTANTDTQSRLYVFVKANILRPGEEAEGITDVEVISLENRATFEKHEKEMQEYEDWPGIKPAPMDPERALDIDEDNAVPLVGRRIIRMDKKGAKEVEVESGKKTQSKQPAQVTEPDGTISLKNGQPLDKSKKDNVKEEKDLPVKKPEPMHPMELLEPDLAQRKE